MIRSIFNNVIGPVMRGPSSSHTAASVRIGQMGRVLLGEEPAYAIFRFDPAGSLATTYRGQGSAMGLAGGLLGMSINDPGLLNAEERALETGLKIKYLIETYGATHPNTYKAVLKGKSGKEVEFTALSTGGGIIRLIELDGKTVTDDLPYINPLMPVKVNNGALLPFTDMDGLSTLVKQGRSLSSLAKSYEGIVGNITEDEVVELSRTHYQIMRDAIENGLAGTYYKDRILQAQSQLIGEAEESGKLIPSSLLNDILASVTAVMETKSSMGVIVAAPTAGSCATLPGTLIPVARLMGKDENDICESILTAGLLGIMIDSGAGFAAEEGGCQYECGSASGMTAAALVELAGGSSTAALAAASMALQNTLGMICDPVADRVEVPCLGKNIMAAMNALSAANMALAGYRELIPLNEVINSMREVANNMDHRYRCTCKGGLSITPTAISIAKRFSKG